MKASELKNRELEKVDSYKLAYELEKANARIAELEAERCALIMENKAMRGELSSLLMKKPINHIKIKLPPAVNQGE